MRSHRRRAPLDHVLIAGDVTELDSIRALLALLPEQAYGQVYVESTAADVQATLLAPPRVTVSHLVRAEHHVIGEALSSAVDCWVAEWMPDDPQPEREIAIWAGGTVTAGVPTLGARLERL